MTILATQITCHTLVGVHGKPPIEKGNCFSVQSESGEEYRIVNFVLENLEHLIEKGLTWPIRCVVVEGRIAVINDARIGDRWYAPRFCEVCCPSRLLPLPQRLKHEREELLGNRAVHLESGTVSFARGSGHAKPAFE